LHPEQEEQQSGESQHDAFAAFAAPAKPSAITANSRIALILFMMVSFLGRNSGCEPTASPSAHERNIESECDF
jgi:hypothetical protein